MDFDSDIWFTAFRNAAYSIEASLAKLSNRVDREHVLGFGKGGDPTLVVDDIAERAVLEELKKLHLAGHDFVVISEELGKKSFGSSQIHVIVDPIDGSANAKRGIPFYSLSVAVALGDRMGEVVLGYVKDFGSGEEWTAVRGAGARLNGLPLVGEGPREHVEVLALESTRMDIFVEYAEALAPFADRVRIMGSCALSLCHFAAGRFDAMCTLRPIRCVDIAAAQLLASERLLPIHLTDGCALSDVPFDLDYRSRVVAAAGSKECDELVQALQDVVSNELFYS